MSLAALGLVLTASALHATWNLIAKRAGGGAPFVLLFGWMSSLLYLPLVAAVVLLRRPHIGPIELVFLAGTAVLHTGYFLALQRGYRSGDLSLVYPVARGTGPMLATAAAIAFFHERPGPIALAGTALIGAGIILLASGPAAWTRPDARRGALYALLTGAFIAAYTLWDKRAVTAIAIHPIVLDWGNNFGRALLMTPLAFTRRAEVREVWAHQKQAVFWIGLLSPMPYILVLTAMVFTPVSYVAPAREFSILIGALMGTRLLAEGDKGRRLVAAGAMVAGLAGLAIG